MKRTMQVQVGAIEPDAANGETRVVSYPLKPCDVTALESYVAPGDTLLPEITVGAILTASWQEEERDEQQ